MQEWQEKIEQEFEQFKQEVKQQIREQITEEIKAAKVIIVSDDALKAISDKLDEQGELLKRIDQKQDEHSKALLSHSKHINALQTTMATKEYIGRRFDAIAQTQKLIIDRLPPIGE